MSEENFHCDYDKGDKPEAKRVALGPLPKAATPRHIDPYPAELGLEEDVSVQRTEVMELVEKAEKARHNSIVLRQEAFERTRRMIGNTEVHDKFDKERAKECEEKKAEHASDFDRIANALDIITSNQTVTKRLVELL